MTTWTVADIPDQHGRTALVTGANSGLGLRASEALAAAGARVLMACRNSDRAAAAAKEVTAVATGAPPEVVTLDLADLDSVRAAASAVADRVDHLDVLLNNAGVMAIPLRRTAQGFELQFGTNHLGHFALTGHLLPLLLAGAGSSALRDRPGAGNDPARVVTVSSTAHRGGRIRWDDLNWERGYRKWSAYSQAKLANLLFAFELARRLEHSGARVVSVAAHPGYASTHLQAVGPEMTRNPLMAQAMNIGNWLFAQSDRQGALPELYAATVPGVRNGDYFGPDGPFESRGSPTLVTARRAAYDLDAARRLWTRSEEMTGVSYPWPTGAGAEPTGLRDHSP